MYAWREMYFKHFSTPPKQVWLPFEMHFVTPLLDSRELTFIDMEMIRIKYLKKHFKKNRSNIIRTHLKDGKNGADELDECDEQWSKGSGAQMVAN